MMFLTWSRAYGSFSNYFVSPPPAPCLPPPSYHILPCPHTARHLLVSASTLPHVFGHAPTTELADPRKLDPRHQRHLFALARTGYETLFRLTPDDARYVDERAVSFFSAAKENGGISIGLHVRRGDCHPFEYQYQRDYLPLDRYLDAAHEILASRSRHTSNISSLSSAAPAEASTSSSTSPDPLAHLLATTSSHIVLASDDPDVYTAPEMAHVTTRAQDRIVLASKATLAHHSTNNKNNKQGFVDEQDGWDRGFYSAVFWNLGRGRGFLATSTTSAGEVTEEKVPEQAMRLRELVGRAYLLDLAVLARTDAVVCGVSAAGCRLLAVMMGEKAVRDGGWRNVDGGLGWRGID